MILVESPLKRRIKLLCYTLLKISPSVLFLCQSFHSTRPFVNLDRLLVSPSAQFKRPHQQPALAEPVRLGASRPPISGLHQHSIPEVWGRVAHSYSVRWGHETSSAPFGLLTFFRWTSYCGLFLIIFTQQINSSQYIFCSAFHLMCFMFFQKMNMNSTRTLTSDHLSPTQRW